MWSSVAARRSAGRWLVTLKCNTPFPDVMSDGFDDASSILLQRSSKLKPFTHDEYVGINFKNAHQNDRKNRDGYNNFNERESGFSGLSQVHRLFFEIGNDGRHGYFTISSFCGRKIGTNPVSPLDFKRGNTHPFCSKWLYEEESIIRCHLHGTVAIESISPLYI